MYALYTQVSNTILTIETNVSEYTCTCTRDKRACVLVRYLDRTLNMLDHFINAILYEVWGHINNGNDNNRVSLFIIHQ